MGKYRYQRECEKCGKPMVLKRVPRGLFWACSGYRECRTSTDLFQGEIEAIMEGLYGLGRDAGPKANQVLDSLLKRIREHTQDLHSDINRYQAERDRDPWGIERWGDHTVLKTSWYCLNRECLNREITIHHTRPVYPPDTDRVFVPCPYCGHDLVLKQER